MMLTLVEDITVVIPTIAPRASQLARALESVAAQTIKPAGIIVVEDEKKEGAALTRDRGLSMVTSEWTAFLDDDDFFYPEHLQACLRKARKTNSDLVYPWFDVHGGTDPFPQFEGQPWSNEDIHQFPVTFLVKTQAAQDVGGFSGGWFDNNAVDGLGNRAGEDWHFIQKFIQAGYKISHLPQRTWGWSHWAFNTSGLPSRW